MDKTFALLVALGGAGILLAAHGNREAPPEPDPPAAAASGPPRPSFDGKWSEEFQPHPEISLLPEQREWSHAEIARRHKALVMKDLPTYITELRGVGEINSLGRTVATWLFTVPKERIPDFEDYLADLGIPREAFRATVTVPTPDWTRDWEGNQHPPPPPTPPAERLLFLQSDVHQVNQSMMGMPFRGRATTRFYLHNPNLVRISVQITFDFRTGNTHVAERPLDPHID